MSTLSIHISNVSTTPCSTMIFERLARGEGDAFEEFVDRYGNLVAHLVRRSLGSSSPDFDDAMQDALFALWRAAPHFDRSRGGETTFIGTIVRRLMIDRRRKAKVRATVALANPGELEDAAEDTPDDRHYHLRGALQRLRPDQRAIVELAVIGGKTHAQIAEAMNLPATKVKHTIHTALSRLREEMSRHRAAA